MKKIILASASPRRKEILEITGLKFEVCTSDFNEDLSLPLKPRHLARFISRKKAEAVTGRYSDAVVIAADTFIVVNGRLLGKPRSMKDAARMLGMLSNRAHSVITGFTIADTKSGTTLSRSVETTVHFRKLDRREITAYVRSKEPMDKAGAYAVQGLGAVFVSKIEGDFFNVVGLPLCAVTEALKEFGVHVLRKKQ